MTSTRVARVYQRELSFLCSLVACIHCSCLCMPVRYTLRHGLTMSWLSPVFRRHQARACYSTKIKAYDSLYHMHRIVIIIIHCHITRDMRRPILDVPCMRSNNTNTPNRKSYLSVTFLFTEVDYRQCQ